MNKRKKNKHRIQQKKGKNRKQKQLKNKRIAGERKALEEKFKEEQKDIEIVEEIEKENIQKPKNKKRVKIKKEKRNDEEKSIAQIQDDNSRKKVFKIIFVVLTILILVSVGVCAYLWFRNKFKDVTIELGTESVTIDDFLISDMYKNYSSIITDMSEITFDKARRI